MGCSQTRCLVLWQDTLHIVRDLDLHLPAANFTDVLVWLQQYRYGTVNGAGYDVDLMIYPDSGCPEIDRTLHSVYVGEALPSRSVTCLQ